MLSLLTSQIERWRGSVFGSSTKPDGHSFEAILIHYWRALEHSSGVEPTGFSPRWLAPFISEAALRYAPLIFFDVVAAQQPSLRHRMYNLLLTTRGHIDPDVYVEALRHSDKGLVALAILLLRERMAGWDLLPGVAGSLSALERAEARAVLAVQRGVAPNVEAIAAMFDAVVFDRDRLGQARPVMNVVCPATDLLYDALADLRSGSEEELLREQIISSWEQTLPIGRTWTNESMMQHRTSEVAHRALISKQYLHNQRGDQRILQVLRGLALNKANAPFLRIRAPQVWVGLWSAILEACAVALRVALGRGSRRHEALPYEFARIVPLFEPEVVQQLDHSAVLQEVIRLAKALGSADVDEAVISLASMRSRVRSAWTAPCGRIDATGNETLE
jgi:hypothetical protein